MTPELPDIGKPWPAHMLGEGETKAKLRDAYARIVSHVTFDRELEREKKAALEWCRANGNPHLAKLGEQS